MSAPEAHMHHHEHGSADCKKVCGEGANTKCQTGCHKPGAGHGTEPCKHDKPAGCDNKCHSGEQKTATDCKGCCN
ncbi:hypothetical protein TcWFU_010269 [Taenia crassiceps]|uniref:Uncharacterized protein n=1 Tax=Taenia crassiceps TaxID=6207 RepID=A0ABR4QIW9_9CEST